MRRALLATLVLACSGLLAACAPAAGSQLTGTTWQLTAYTEKVPAFQGVVPAEMQPHYTILFNSDSTFSATADCNAVSGTYSTSGSNITITPGPSTMAFCGEESLDALYIHMLGSAASYAIANNQLTLTLASEGTMTFGTASGSPAPADSPAAAGSPATAPSDATGGLLGKAWQLTAVTEKVPAFQGVIPDDQQASYTITFDADGSFQAQADCNAVSGTYSTADPTAASGDLSIFPGPSTLVACPEGSFGDLFTIGLGSAASYEVASDVLTITLVNDGTLTFK
jgi:heat shock protein HslJ